MGSSGILRMFNFVKYLLVNGWSLIVFIVNFCVYEECCDDLLKSILVDMKVIWVFVFDVVWYFGIKCKYLSIFVFLDCWFIWWFGVVLVGLKEIRKEKLLVLWSIYFIILVYLIGVILVCWIGLFWVVDF